MLYGKMSSELTFENVYQHADLEIDLQPLARIVVCVNVNVLHICNTCERHMNITHTHPAWPRTRCDHTF